MSNAAANPPAVSTLVEPAFVLNSFLPSGLLLFPVFCFQQYFQPLFPRTGTAVFPVFNFSAVLLTVFPRARTADFPVFCFSAVFPALFCWPNPDLFVIQAKTYPKLHNWITNEKNPFHPLFSASRYAMTCMACWKFPEAISSSICSFVYVSTARNSQSSSSWSFSFLQFFARKI